MIYVIGAGGLAFLLRWLNVWWEGMVAGGYLLSPPKGEGKGEVSNLLSPPWERIKVRGIGE